MRKYLLLLFVACPFIVKAQITPAEDTPSVRIFADSRIDLLTGKPEAKPYSGKARGFRVQIYNGYDRNKANNLKVTFMQKHSGMRAYLIYNKPHFRVRVGDFPSRAAAAELYRQLSGTYTCMIVPDIINIAPPKNNGN
jgi:hypothetical protein